MNSQLAKKIDDNNVLHISKNDKFVDPQKTNSQNEDNNILFIGNGNVNLLNIIGKIASKINYVIDNKISNDEINSFSPDVIIIDSESINDDFYTNDLCKLKELTRGDIPIIFVIDQIHSNIVENGLVDKALNEYADDVITFTPDSYNQNIILRRIKNYINQKKLKEQNNKIINLDVSSKFVSDSKKFIEMGKIISQEKDMNKLLEIILNRAGEITNSDAGTLYMIKNNELSFELFYNKKFNVRNGDKRISEINIPNVKLYNNGKENHENVSSYVALTGNIVNIPDVYEAEGFDFTGTRKYDEKSNYRSKSMLVMPLKNNEDKIIGVFQLINAINPINNEVITFSNSNLELVESLSAHAAISLTNSLLVKNLKESFNRVITTISNAIDAKSKHTGEHMRRVVDITMRIANAINNEKTGVYKDIHFSQDQLKEIEIAAKLHDIGKIITPEYIINKSTKLESTIDTIDLIELRFKIIAKICEISDLKKQIKILKEQKNQTSYLTQQQSFGILNNDETIIDINKDDLKDKLKELSDDFEFLKKCNEGQEFMNDGMIYRVKMIANKAYKEEDEIKKFLTFKEEKNLCIRKGNLNNQEITSMQEHVVKTKKILEEMGFPYPFDKVAKIAGDHHEKLNGKGYPNGKKGDEILLQTRILTIADIFEALTTKSRPYRSGIMSLSTAIKILCNMAQNFEIDKNLFLLFINKGIYMQFSQENLLSSQIDMNDIEIKKMVFTMLS